MTIELEITRGVDSTRVFDFVNDFDFMIELCEALNYNKIGNILVKNVPKEIEYELSKYIFNQAEIFKLKVDNVTLLDKLEDAHTITTLKGEK